LSLAGEISREQQPVGYGVDAARDSSRGIEDAFVSLRQKRWIAVPSDAFQPMFDVASRLVSIQGADVARSNHALPQLLHLRALHRTPELRLTDKETLEERMSVELEIRQHSQLLDRARRKVLRFVDNEQCAFPLLAYRHEECFE